MHLHFRSKRVVSHVYNLDNRHGYFKPFQAFLMALQARLNSTPKAIKSNYKSYLDLLCNVQTMYYLYV